ncbi:hypothetical protein B0H13DRAFT_2320997 [Mycena leptocephala]|nr:hypothetical protein B0H13DRAFT_2320997 [Mycena leptocephala]
MAQPSKTLLVFCDGTGLDGILGVESADEGSHNDPVSNVLRLSRAVKKYREFVGKPKIPQIVLYQSGVGSQAGFDHAQSGVLGVGESVNKAVGKHVASKIREADVFIAQNYVAGDLICLFGFSRGAYTARKVAGIIDRVGILSGKELYTFSDGLLNPKTHIEHKEVKVTTHHSDA